eukprot:1918881-Rhodomonas_salina.8
MIREWAESDIPFVFPAYCSHAWRIKRRACNRHAQWVWGRRRARQSRGCRAHQVVVSPALFAQHRVRKGCFVSCVAGHFDWFLIENLSTYGSVAPLLNFRDIKPFPPLRVSCTNRIDRNWAEHREHTSLSISVGAIRKALCPAHDFEFLKRKEANTCIAAGRLPPHLQTFMSDLIFEHATMMCAGTTTAGHSWRAIRTVANGGGWNGGHCFGRQRFHADPPLNSLFTLSRQMTRKESG